MQALSLAIHFTRREIRNRYLGSVSGALWALLQPLAQLTIYGFVWAYVFKMRLPNMDTSPAGVVPFLALGVWPWNAFAESIARSTTALIDNASLIGKVALPRGVFVFSSTCASFLLHGFGFLAILIVLALLGMPLHLSALPQVIAVFVQLFVLALGFAYLFSALQVFIRDLAQALTQLITLWMFLSPVLYSREMLPEAYRGWLDLNPFSFYPEYFRSQLLHFGSTSLQEQLVALCVALAVLFVGIAVFRRLDKHFEDFL